MTKYARYIYFGPRCEVSRLTGERVKEAFSHIWDSAGALDGWANKELALFSNKMCERVAVMLNQIEDGHEPPPC